MSSNTTGQIQTLPFVGVSEKSKMAAWNESSYQIRCSAAKRNSNNIPSAIPMFLRSSNMTALVRILSYVMMSGISKMAACNRNWIYTTSLPQTLTWKSIRISPVMMLDSNNRYIRWNFVAISCTSGDKLYSITTSSYRPPSLIAHSLRHTAVFKSVQLCCLTSKT